MTKEVIALLALALLFIVQTTTVDGYGCTTVKCSSTDKSGVKLQWFSGHVVANTTVINREFDAIINGNESTCIESCIEMYGCRAIVVAVGDERCWLYKGDDIYTSAIGLNETTGFKIFSLGHGACRRRPCKNKGVCVPNHINLSYQCKCRTGYYGRHCTAVDAGKWMPMTPTLHFTFDDGTDDPRASFPYIKLLLKRGVDYARLVTPSDRRGRVLFVEGSLGPKRETVYSRNNGMFGESTYNGWFRNFLTYDGTFMLSFWIKNIRKQQMMVTDLVLFRTNVWRIVYNYFKSVLKVEMGTMQDLNGKDFRLKCKADIRTWRHVAVAAYGSSITPLRPVKLYLDGRLCHSRNFGDSKYTAIPVDHKKELQDRDTLNLLIDSEGQTMMDELKLFDEAPATDNIVNVLYEKEKKMLMN